MHDREVFEFVIGIIPVEDSVEALGTAIGCAQPGLGAILVPTRPSTLQVKEDFVFRPGNYLNREWGRGRVYASS